MEGNSSRSQKRPFLEDDDSYKPPVAKKPRFPKGKKVKGVDEVVVVASGPKEAPVDLTDPKIAAKNRAKQRSQMTFELYTDDRGNPSDIATAEVRYEENANLVEDGISIEPFNLDQEREEGYFDENGNYVEYANENGIKDAWLDSVDVDPKLAEKRFAERSFNMVKDNEDAKDLLPEDVWKIKRRIANLLEPGETILQALKRLKGTSTGKKEKMPEETKLVFDQLTEDSMKLMDNGDYDVYHEKREAFEREAGQCNQHFYVFAFSCSLSEGYEMLARAREGTSIAVGLTSSDLNISTVQGSSRNADEEFDMFAEDDEGPISKSSSDANGLVSGSAAEPYTGPSSESGNLETDYVYDESSGYYYSSTLGYYYDPTSGLYCSASSGKWYSFNEQAGTYEEVQGEGESSTPIN